MTFERLDLVLDLVDECKGYSFTVGLIYQYFNALSHKILYACFAKDQPNDIHESPYVKNPILVYDGKRFVGKHSIFNIRMINRAYSRWCKDNKGQI